jgi:glycerophosphoryl diester phosphodiesterase
MYAAPGDCILVNPTLRRFCEIMPDVPVGFLYHSAGPDDAQLNADFAHEALHPHHSMIDSAYMAWAKANACRVNTWTVNDPARAIELRDMGVDGIITDSPEVILKALRG